MFKRSPAVSLCRPQECLVDWAVLVVKIEIGLVICKEDLDANYDKINKEKKKSTIVLTTSAVSSALFDETRYGTLTTLLRHTGYILRAYGNVIADRLDRPKDLRQGLITPEEMQFARFYWMRHLQQQAFGEELKRLGKNKFVRRDSNLSIFHPYRN